MGCSLVANCRAYRSHWLFALAGNYVHAEYNALTPADKVLTCAGSLDAAIDAAPGISQATVFDRRRSATACGRPRCGGSLGDQTDGFVVAGASKIARTRGAGSGPELRRRASPSAA